LVEDRGVSRRGQDVVEWLSAPEATALLGIKKETLYAYASRGMVRSVAGDTTTRGRRYFRDDLERLSARSRARAGHGPVAAAALRWGEPVLETSIGTITPAGPAYRGHAAVELARSGKTFEDVCALLWDGAFVSPVESHVPRTLRSLLPRDAEPFDAMLVAASVLAVSEPRGEGIDATRRRAGALVHGLVAACALTRGEVELDPSRGVACTLLTAFGATTSAKAVRAMNEALILSAEHELNVSTFAARVAASTGANLAASIVAGLAALSGPLHGALTARVEALVDEIGRPERAAEVIAARIGRGESIAGYGHPLYPDGDPRGAHLLELAQRLSRASRTARILVAVTNAMLLAGRERPTLDVGLVALASALSLPRGAPIAVFACGRLAGWIAHVLEQREAGHLLRPRARYIGRS
jgi:citrate synthase